MAFQLKSQSPITQKKKEIKDVMSQFKDSSKNKTIQKSLDDSNEVVSKAKSNKKQINIQDKIVQDSRRPMNPVVKSIGQLIDPTGFTSYPDVKKAWSDNKFNSSDILEPIGALPIIGKIPKLIKGLKTVSSITRGAKIASKVNSVTPKINKASRITNQEKVGEAVVESPLRKQKLSPKAAKAKATRDLAYAKTDDRKAKKAHSQRMRRKDPNGKGKDWDHEDGRWESVKQNRGNEGEGTKKESGKNYKIK